MYNIKRGSNMNFFYDIKELGKELNPIFSKLREKVRLSANADKHYSGKIDITEVLKPFTHLTLDDKYKIIASDSAITAILQGKTYKHLPIWDKKKQ